MSSYNPITRTVNNIADLRLQKGGNSSVATKMNVLGYYTPGDGGDNEFVWNKDSTDPDDGGLTIGSWTIGRWKAKESRIIRVKTFGVKGDGITDDTLALQSAINAASNKILDWQDVQCYTTSTLTISSPLKFTRGMALIKSGHNGVAILAKTIAGNGLLGGDNPAFVKGYYPSTVLPVVWRWTNPQSDLKDGSTGIRLENCMNWDIVVPHISGFNKGFELAAVSSSPTSKDGGTSYNSIQLGRLSNHINFNFDVTPSSGNLGYVNSNKIYDGSLNSFNSNVASDSTHIKFGDANDYWQCNHNVFYGTVMEGFHKIGVDFGTYSLLNQIMSPRLEMNQRTYYVKFGNNSQANIIRDPYSFNIDMSTYMVDTGRYNEMTGTAQKYGRFTYYDTRWTFTNLNITESTGIPYTNTDWIGETTFFNVSYTGTPITLDWKLGRKFRIVMAESVTSMPANSVSIINAPSDINTAIDWQFEILLLQPSAGCPVDQNWLTNIKYAEHPKPYTRTNGRDRYFVRRSFQSPTVGYHVISHSSDNYLVSGSTAQYPINPYPGQFFYDTQLQAPMWANNSGVFTKAIKPIIFTSPNVGNTLLSYCDILILPIITSSKILTFNPSLLITGQLLTIDNQNTTSGQNWITAGVNLYKADGITQITQLDNARSYQFFYDGSKLIETVSVPNSILNQTALNQSASFHINGTGAIGSSLSIALTSPVGYPLEVGTLPSILGISALFSGRIIIVDGVNNNEAVTVGQLNTAITNQREFREDITTPQTSSDLNALYPSAPIGFSVYAKNSTSTGNGLIYIKDTSTTWAASVLISV